VTRHKLFGDKSFRVARRSILAVAVVAAGACSREPAPETSRQETAAPAADAAAKRQQDQAEEVARLNQRVTEIERKYAEANREVTSGARTATAGLREEVKEDVTNVKEAVKDLGTTTPANWWERQEQAMARTADDIEADVRRIGKAAPANARPTGTAGARDAGEAPFTSRRDAFIASLQARVDAMEKSLEGVKASGARETELADTRDRIAKLEADIDKVRSASADDWWDISKERVTGYVERVEDSVGRLDDDKPARE
jgi:hypothetical protein